MLNVAYADPQTKSEIATLTVTNIMRGSFFFFFFLMHAGKTEHSRGHTMCLKIKKKEFIVHSYFSVLPSIGPCIRDRVLAAHSVIAYSVSRPHEKALSSYNTLKSPHGLTYRKLQKFELL